MTKSATYFKKFGNAANLAAFLRDWTTEKDSAAKENLRQMALYIYEGCEWRKAFDEKVDGVTFWTGKYTWIDIRENAERGFKYLTIDRNFSAGEVEHFFALLDQLNITEFVYTSRSTAVMNDLMAFIENGWKVAGSIIQTYTRYGEEETVSGLIIKKAKKN